MDTTKITTKLRSRPIPKAARRRFKNVFDFAVWVKEARKEKNLDRLLFNLLAFEYQNERRQNVMNRIHMTFNRERQTREREDLTNASR